MKKRAVSKLPKELSFEEQIKRAREDGVVYCPVCKRGYLLEEEKELIKEKGRCYACQYFADNIKPYAIEGKFCSVCQTELDVEMDEDWDETGFVMLPYLWCSKCKARVATHANKEESSIPIPADLPF